MNISSLWCRALGWAGVFLLALLGGCAGTIATKVTNFHAWPSDAAGATFAMAPFDGQTPELEQATWNAYVAAELQRQGLVSAAAGSAARFVVEVTATGYAREKKMLEPVYQQTTVFVPPYRDAAGNVLGGFWVPDPFGPRWVGEREVSRTVQVSRIKVRITEPHRGAGGKAGTVFDATALYEGRIEDLSDLVPLLVKAVFDEFPGTNGRVRTLKFDAETGALIRR